MILKRFITNFKNETAIEFASPFLPKQGEYIILNEKKYKVVTVCTDFDNDVVIIDIVQSNL